MDDLSTLYLAWEDSALRHWYPVGRLTFRDEQFVYVYTKGAIQAQSEVGFKPFASFPQLETVYVSNSLFPLFSNRVMTKSRPDFQDYWQWLNFTSRPAGPLNILERNGGRRVTDTLEVFPRPERDDTGAYQVYFWLKQGELPTGNLDALKTGDALTAVCEPQDGPAALRLRTADDPRFVGFVPRYLRPAVYRAMISPPGSLKVTVARVNPAPAPSQFRVLCHASIRLPPDEEMLDGPEYQPIVSESDLTGADLPLGHASR